MVTEDVEAIIETKPQGEWIGNERIEELAEEGFVLSCFGDVRTINGNTPLGAWFTKYVFYRISRE